MDHDTTGNIWGVAGGILLGIGSYVLKMDWNGFLEQLSVEGIKVGVLGIIGGIGGLVGKKLADRLFFKRKKK